MAFSWKNKKDIYKGEGLYHLTFAVVNRVPLLGTLTKNKTQGTAQEHIARVECSELGVAVSKEFSKLMIRYPHLQILAKQVMPDHFHVVVWMHEGFEGSVKMIARGFAQGCSKVARRMAERGSTSINAQFNCARTDGEQGTNMEHRRNDAMHESYGREKRQQESNSSEKRQQESYDCGNGANTLFSTPFIRTVAHKGQLYAMINYVHANPDNAWMRRINPELYVIRRCVRYGGLEFDTMGKTRLLDWPDRQVIALSRSLNDEEIDMEVKDALYHASQGTVTYTAAINKGEKAVARAVREAGYPLVILLLDGFPPEGSEAARFFHPSGVYHEACGRGQLLLLAPLPSCYENVGVITKTEQELSDKAAKKVWHYTPIPHDSKRWKMIAGNVILKLIANATSI